MLPHGVTACILGPGRLGQSTECQFPTCIDAAVNITLLNLLFHKRCFGKPSVVWSAKITGSSWHQSVTLCFTPCLDEDA